MANVHVGDCIILTTPGGRCAVFTVAASGEHIKYRENIASLHQAWAIARGSLTSRQIWIGDEATPDELTSY
jgi:hypothetical protein